MSAESIETCESHQQLCPCGCGEELVFHCAQRLLRRDPTDPKQACPGATFICWDCVDEFGELMTRAYDARARRMEWQVE